MKRIISILLLIATLLSAFFITAFAADDDDNAMSGEGNTNAAAKGYAWYNSKQYLWKVTLFVGRSDGITKQDNLEVDFHRIGTVIMKKTGWTVPANTKFGSGTKVDYYSGEAMTVDTSPYIISDANCPAVPYACGGDLETVKAYFGSTGTMATILNGIAADKGTTKQGLFSNMYFTIGGQTKKGWDFEYLDPNATTNRVPWVIVYEPMILLNLKDNVTKVAFTATEYALCEIYGWYDWNNNGGTGQNCSSLPERYLPTSVQLEESWFGYPVYGITDGSYRWKHEDIVKGGGWGMRWMDPAVTSQIPPDTDYGCGFVSVDSAPTVGGYGNVTVSWTNYEATEGTVLCCLYRGETLLWSGWKTIPAGTTIRSSFSVYYGTAGQQVLACNINWDNRMEETDPTDNSDITYVTPVQTSVPPALDYGVEIRDWEQPNQNSYGRVDLWWKNWTGKGGTVLCELYMDGSLIWSEKKTFAGNQDIDTSVQVYYDGYHPRTLEARINYAYCNSEADPSDNVASVIVTPTKTTDDTYDFSVSELTVTPTNVYQGSTCLVEFTTDNWNRDLSYEDILVEVLVDGKVVKTQSLDYEAYGQYQHSYSIYLEDLGSHTVTARINWANRNLEDNRDNNQESTTNTVKPYYEFSISDLQVMESCYIGDTILVSFCTDSWDEFNAYEDVSVEVLVDGKVVTTKYLDYDVYGGYTHNWYITVSDSPTTHKITARINWASRASESMAENNITDTVEVVVKERSDLTLEVVQPNSSYRAGMTVITSYIMHNNSDEPVLPDNDNVVLFEAYYYDQGKRVDIACEVWDVAVIPAHGQNLVYFKWTVPSNIVGKVVYCEAMVNADQTVMESHWDNNTAILTQTIATRYTSSTQDTQFEKDGPEGYKIPAGPMVKTGTSTWSQWFYEDDAFVEKTYGITFATTKPAIEPDEGSPSAEFVNGYWQMRSGYGLYIRYRPTLKTISGYETAPTEAYTGIQWAEAAFPEFNYSQTTVSMRTLQNVGGTWMFAQNPNADGNERLHFTPLWYPNGAYVVFVTATEVWTPTGMIYCVQNSNIIRIVDSAYDDWYVGEE